MPELVANCPRCGSSHMSFDVMEAHIIREEHGWQNWYEAFCICRHCKRATIFILSESVNADYEHVHRTGLLKLTEAVNRYTDIKGFVSLKDSAARQPPEHLPEQIDLIFREGATCLSVGCYNAAGTMFRLCVDLASSYMLPEGEVEA